VDLLRHHGRDEPIDIAFAGAADGAAEAHAGRAAIL
jgi:hypothetical protein